MPAHDDADAALMPEARTLLMPEQPLSGDVRHAGWWLGSSSILWRRALLLTATVGMTFGGLRVMGRLLDRNGPSLIDGPLLFIFAILFSWVAFSFVAGVAGFVVSWKNVVRDDGGVQPVILTRTALLLPICNEDSIEVLARIQAIQESLAELGVGELYDTFVLSDTSDPEKAALERQGVLNLRRVEACSRIYYRRRTENTERKAGNIADWVRLCGRAYESMIILDADSLMSGETLVRLTAAMERDPHVGLIQTLPLIINARTMFGRLQQFAGRMYGPMTAEGQNWWSGSEGNYWGHNAIIRTRAFATHAGLPRLKGVKPFGGHILSHDFVEAALLRRGGWAVRMIVEQAGSYEETPPTLIATAKRDRRWCQGNLQHGAVLGAKGLHWVSRLHLIRGILSYATAPLWLAFLGMGALVWTEQMGDSGPVDPWAIWLMVATTVFLLGPKLLAGLLLVRSPGALRACGGPFRLMASLVLEIVMSVLIAPSMMLMQSRAVFEVLSGRDAGWASQQRGDVDKPGRQAWLAHRWHVALGAVCAVGAFVLDPSYFWWTSPVTVGLMLSAAVSALSAQTSIGDALRARGLLLTPEEASPPAIVERANALRDAAAQRQAYMASSRSPDLATATRGTVMAGE